MNISSAAGMLTDKKNTKAGAVFFSSNDNSKPFTFFVETELGQVFSVNAAPRREGRSYRLMPATQTARPLRQSLGKCPAL